MLAFAKSRLVAAAKQVRYLPRALQLAWDAAAPWTVAWGVLLAVQGVLPLATVLLCRIRYFSDGMVLGAQALVQAQLAAYRERTGRRKHLEPQPVPAIADWGELTTLRALRGKGLG